MNGKIDMKNKIQINDLPTYYWKGFKDFVVYKKYYESDSVVSIYIKPKDGSKITLPKPGQFVGIRFNNLIRLYNISCIPNTDFYRLTIDLIENGKMSNYISNTIQIGDTIECTVPKGKVLM
ncbi:FAD-binding oxidoreductase [Clostridium thermobutyricum]|uniref:FAD-binding oxidoreductase n=1 Tax=Clostridium thermobutyricum TaxID=29372 RepID=UPI00294391AD|nr:FAD-binding oxidoreductase [Clostridium thermobutyricum]